MRRAARRATLGLLALGILFGAASMVGPAQAVAQGESSKLDVLLERISFNCAETPETFGRALAELDASELTALCDMLVEPGAGDDTKARMALHGLALYLGSGGSEQQRDRFIDALGSALVTNKPVEVKRFLIRQLQLAGDARAVATLASFLHDDELHEPAVQALTAIGGEEVAEAFRNALPNAEGQARIALINALGRLRDQAAAPMFMEDSESESQELRAVASAALASIGLPDADRAPIDAMLEPESWYENMVATALLFLRADRLAARGARARAAEEYLLWLQTREPAEVHVRCAALHGLARLQGPDAVGHVVRALTDDNLEFRTAAAGIAVALPGPEVTAAFVDELDTNSATARTGVLTVLERRGDASALPAALAALHDADKDVRIAAVKAAARLGEERAVEPLVAFLSTADDDERPVAEQVLTVIRGDNVSEQVARLLPASAPPVRATLLNVLARRGAKSELKTVFAFVTDRDENVQIAAIDAIGALADASAASILVALLRKTESTQVREAVEAALVAVCSRAPSAAARATPIITAIERDNARDYCSLLRVLGRIGGEPALETVRQAARDARPEVREAAIRAVSNWPDAAAATEALTIARETEELKHHVLAMRAYARLVALDQERPVGQTLQMFTDGMEVARRVDEKKLILSRLAEVKDPQTLEMLDGYLADEALRSETASAMIGVARGLLPGGWATARTALEKVLASVDDEPVRRQAEDVLREVAEHEDYITDWLVCGPYMVEGKRGHEILEVAFPPELPDAKDAAWKQQVVPKDGASFWYVNLNTSVGGEHRAAYLRTCVWSATTQGALLELGSDDHVKVWVNKKLIHTNKVHRGCARGQDKVKTTLDEGWNEVLLKVVNNDGGWAACLRVRAPDGGRLEGLKVDANRRP